MTVQDDKEAGQDGKTAGKSDDKAGQDAARDGDEHLTEKPEPNEDNKKAAAEMMTAYHDKPTIVLPGSAGKVSGTAVNDWLDDDGNPKYEVPDGADSDADAEGNKAKDNKELQEQIEQDKALNEKLKESGAEENKGETRPTP